MAQNPPPAPAASPVTTTRRRQASARSRKAAAPRSPRPEPAPATVASVVAAGGSECARGDAGHAADAVEIDHGATGSRGRKADRTVLPPKPFTAAPMPDVVASTSARRGRRAGRIRMQCRRQGPADRICRSTSAAPNSIDGLRALWRGLLKSNPALAALRPVIAVKEGRSGLGMQLRLVAGPLRDAAAAAKICAGLVESKRSCETTEFDGQRLAMNGRRARRLRPSRLTASEAAASMRPSRNPAKSRALGAARRSSAGAKPCQNSRDGNKLGPLPDMLAERAAAWAVFRVVRHPNSPAYSRLSLGRLTGFHEPEDACSEKNSVPADALPGAMADGRRLPDRRLRALSALSRDRVFDGGAGLRCRLADHAVQDPRARDLPCFAIRCSASSR